MKKSFDSMLMLALSLLVVSCGSNSTSVMDKSDFEREAPTFIHNELVDFSLDTSTVLQKSDGRGNGDPFGVMWNAGNTTFDSSSSTMNMLITKSGDTYYGGEIRTLGDVGKVQYGYFSTEMKPSDVVGTASTFFTYTGPAEGNPHDEIDIEFLGKDTTKVQFNYFVDDVGGHEYMYDLGFDASKEFHKYGFYWDESKIIWYVDDQPVYGVTGKVPSNPQRVYSNFWLGNQENKGITDWMGKINDSNLPATASYRHWSISYLNGYGLDVELPEPAPKYEDFIPSTLSFNNGSLDVYNVEVNADQTENHINYTNISQLTYKNVNSPVKEEINSGEYVAFKIKNNGTDDYVKVRADVRASKVNAAGITTINTKGWQDGDLTKTDLVYGGSFFDIEPGQESICIIKFYGIAEKISLMIDTAGRKDKDTYTGDITVSGFGYYGESHYVDEWVKLNTNSLRIKPGEEIQLTADASGEVTYSAENPNIAKVTSDGKVTGVSEGSTTITAKSGSGSASCTVIVTNKEPKEEETMNIVDEASDIAHRTNMSWGNATYAKETTNVYGNSTEGVSWSKAKAGEGLFFNVSSYEISADDYIEFFYKSVGHTSSSNGETMNGLLISIYNDSSKVGSDVKAYKTYNAEYSKDAGNGWLYYKLPITLFGDSGTFDGFKVKIYANMDEGEVMYIDGINITSTPAGGTEDPSTDPSTPTEVDHSKETLPIVDEVNDTAKITYASLTFGTFEKELVNTYGTSTEAIKFTSGSAGDGIVLQVKGGSGANISANGYVEFFVKNVGHSSGSNGVLMCVYNNLTKIGGDIKLYNSYNETCRKDAGNGWIYYKVPASLFTQSACTITEIKIKCSQALNSGECFYIDGINIVE